MPCTPPATGRLWLCVARRCSCPLTPAELLHALAFTARLRARSFVVPVTLTRTAVIGRQERLRLLDGRLRLRQRPVRLRLVAVHDGVVASSAAGPVGAVPPRHAPWVVRLLPAGLSAYAVAVTADNATPPLQTALIALAGLPDALAVAAPPLLRHTAIA